MLDTENPLGIDVPELYDAIWNKYGPNQQVDKIIEEMSELTKAFLKARLDGKIFTESVEEEIADVIIMLEQFLHHARRYPADHDEEDWSAWKEIVVYRKQKLNKLESMVDSK